MPDLRIFRVVAEIPGFSPLRIGCVAAALAAMERRFAVAISRDAKKAPKSLFPTWGPGMCRADMERLAGYRCQQLAG